MKNKTITLDGIEYNLVPVEDEKDTQSITYFPEGAANTNNREYWDNNIFLVDILEESENIEVTNLRKEIGDPKFINLINILQKD